MSASADIGPQGEPPVVESPLLLLDYDGTLAEISDEPSSARPHPAAPELLALLARRFPVRILTGRRVADLASLLSVPGLVALGVHGMEEGALAPGDPPGAEHETAATEPDAGAGPSRPAASGTGAGAPGGLRMRLADDELKSLDRVRSALPAVSGVRLEDKGAALALHYRGAADEERVVAELQEWSRRLPEGLETVWGKKVVEVRPAGFDKGRAARELAAEHPASTPVMIGDDTTDEDAFEALEQGVTIKVGGGDSAARFRLGDVDAVIGYLRRYLE